MASSEAHTNSIAGDFSVETSTNLTDWEYLAPPPRATTNIALPASHWTALPSSLLIEWPPGFYQLADPSATNAPRRYYRLRWP